MKKLLATLTVLLLVLTLGTGGALAANGKALGKNTGDTISITETMDTDGEAAQDESVSNADAEAEDDQGDAAVEDEQETDENDEDAIEEADAEDFDGLKKGWKKTEKLLEKFEEKQEALMEKMEKKLERLEENGNVDVELLKKKFEARLEEMNRKFEERIKLMQGRLRARGREIAFRDAFPVIKAGRTLIPVRAVTETLGAKVGWDPETSTITITRDDITIVINLGSREYTVNGEVKTFDVPAQLINNRTFVPLRYIAEELGEKVSYDPETGDVNIGADELAEEEGEETAAETGGVATGETDENTGQINVEENQSNPEENTAQQTTSDQEVTTQQ